MKPIKVLAATALAEITLEEHPRFGAVVRKRMLDFSADVTKFRMLWKNEAIALSRFVHPNIVPLLDSGLNEGRPWLLLPFIPGVTLDKMLRDHKQKPAIAGASAVRILRELLGALAVLHEARTLNGEPDPHLHGDINPRNILIGEDGRIRLIDFALCSPSPVEPFGKGLVGAGSPDFMSPGRSAGLGYDVGDDIFAVGRIATRLFLMGDGGEGRAATTSQGTWLTEWGDHRQLSHELVDWSAALMSPEKNAQPSARAARYRLDRMRREMNV